MVFNIRKNEKEILITQKLREGLDVIEAQEEVERDIEFINNLKEMKNRLEREVKQMEKKKEKVSQDFKKQFTKLQKKEEPIKRKVHGKFYHANTNHLKRILNYLKEVETAPITPIARDNCTTASITSDGLRFLIKLGLVREVKVKGGTNYQLVTDTHPAF